MNKKQRNDKMDGRYYTDEYIQDLTKRIYDLEKIIEEIKQECEENIKIFDSGKSYSIAFKHVSEEILKIINKEGKKENESN